MGDYDFKKIAQDVASREGIKDYKIVYKNSSNKGDGYTGTVKAVQLAGTNKSLDVVFKYAHRDPKAHESMPLREVYLKEINFYKVIAPEFERFQKEYNIQEPFDNTAKFYGCVSEPLNELLVLENLSVDNYDLWNRKEPMNQSHLELTLKTFAKFHAISFAMKQLKPGLYKDLTNHIPENNLMISFFDLMDFYSQISKAIDDVIDIFEEKYAAKLKSANGCLREKLTKALDYKDVILQGDCWCNNAMYQYENLKDRSTPKNMKMIDFQIVSLGSPVMDVSYFFYTIAPKECIDNLDYFLKLYHEEMKKHLSKFNVAIENVYSYERLLEDWKVLSIFGLAFSFCAKKAMLTESEDAPDFFEDAKNFIGMLRISPEKELLYREQIKTLVIHFVDRGFM